MDNNRIIATDRQEHETCERLTPGCCIDHTAEARQHKSICEHDNAGCETW